jgi:hypothetical protein
MSLDDQVLVNDSLSVVLDNLPASRPEMVHKLSVVEYSVLIMDCLQRSILSILEKRKEVRKFEGMIRMQGPQREKLKSSLNSSEYNRSRGPAPSAATIKVTPT